MEDSGLSVFSSTYVHHSKACSPGVMPQGLTCMTFRNLLSPTREENSFQCLCVDGRWWVERDISRILLFLPIILSLLQIFSMYILKYLKIKPRRILRLFCFFALFYPSSQASSLFEQKEGKKKTLGGKKLPLKKYYLNICDNSNRGFKFHPAFVLKCM